jgi:hypothetical protein
VPKVKATSNFLAFTAELEDISKLERRKDKMNKKYEYYLHF